MVYKYEDIIAKIIFLSEIEFSKKIAESCIEQAKKFGINIIPFKGVHGYKSEDILKDNLVENLVSDIINSATNLMIDDN